MQQQALIHSSYGKFRTELNEHLMNGCKVVPGTFYAGSYEDFAVPNFTPPHFTRKDGTTIRTVFFVVLELPS